MKFIEKVKKQENKINTLDNLIKKLSKKFK